MFDRQDDLPLETEDLLGELSEQTSQETHRQRSGTATRHRVAVAYRLAGASHAKDSPISANSLELGKQSLLIESEHSPLVGDVFELCFPDGDVRPQNVLGICQRCRLLSQRKYEASFQLFSPLHLM
ncbi:MAG: hypothetical protein CSA62_00690 [Planctomycetota bacterium]|nr:MAG: hypothetical protein CSA62_00690 [Planctomycetota bacterium]